MMLYSCTHVATVSGRQRVSRTARLSAYTGSFATGWGLGRGLPQCPSTGKNYWTKLEVREPFHPTFLYQIARYWVPRELGQGQC